MRRYELGEIVECLRDRGLEYAHVASEEENSLGSLLFSYLNYRAELLDTRVRAELMNRDQACAQFEHLRRKLHPRCHLPMNKQKGKKRHHGYLVGVPLDTDTSQVFKNSDIASAFLHDRMSSPDPLQDQMVSRPSRVTVISLPW